MTGKMLDFLRRMRYLSCAMLLLTFSQGSAQKYFTRDGTIEFMSDASVEKIEAVNQKVASVLDCQSGQVEFAVLIKSFHFEKALMEEHFNENYLESNKYPKATFKGTITNMSEISFTVPGSYDAKVQGDLTIHGVTKPLTVIGMIKVSPGEIFAKSTFEITVADYDIEIPKLVRDNIAKIVQIHAEMNYKPLEQ
jgi:hypothetical protein